jgi:O-methyltransferase involved in polyketide biosynthesis
LQWIEVDLPELLAYKTEQLAGETPRCNLERVALDLSNVAARRELFERLNARATSVMIVSEGLVVYLAPEEVLQLATDLARTPRFQPLGARHGVAGAHADDAEDHGPGASACGRAVQFAPNEGPAFFARAGWKPLEVRSLLHTAATLKRLSWRMRLFALLPDSAGRVPSSPWGGVCLFEKNY